MALATSPEMVMDWTTEELVVNARKKFERLFEKLKEAGPWSIHTSERGLDVCNRPVIASAESNKGLLITQAIARHEAAMRLTRRLNIKAYEGVDYSHMVSEMMSSAKVESIEYSGENTKVTVSISPENIRKFKKLWIG